MPNFVKRYEVDFQVDILLWNEFQKFPRCYPFSDIPKIHAHFNKETWRYDHDNCTRMQSKNIQIFEHEHIARFLMKSYILQFNGANVCSH